MLRILSFYTWPWNQLQAGFAGLGGNEWAAEAVKVCALGVNGDGEEKATAHPRTLRTACQHGHQCPCFLSHS